MPLTTPSIVRLFRVSRLVATRASVTLPLLLAACGGATPEPATPANTLPGSGTAQPAPVDTTPPAKADARGALRQEDFATLFTRPRAIDVAFPAAPEGTPPPPASCDAYVKRSIARSCDDTGARANLAAAYAEPDAARADAKLADLEKCTTLPVGLVRALRAERAPAACGDAIVAPFLASNPAPAVTPAMQHTLYGLGIGARLARTGAGMPTLAAPFTKDRVQTFIAGPVAAWLTQAATSVQANAEWATRLEGYGRGIAAVEAGLADLRLVDAIRSAPIPDDFAKDAELKATYESSLDEKLAPRLARGRDAALVGLRAFAEVGSLVDPRGDRARDLLSKLYAGRRIDSLDALIVPILPPFKATNADEALASILPTFYSGVLFNADAMTAAPLLRALLEEGFPTAARANLKKHDASNDTRRLEAAGRILLARRYWRAVDVEEALAIAATWDPPTNDTEALIGALAQALRGGPEDAPHMMLAPPTNGLKLGDASALEKLGNGASTVAGPAMFDAARIEQLSTPLSAPAAAWHALAEKYRAAAAKLAEPAKSDAKTRANDADSVGNATK